MLIKIPIILSLVGGSLAQDLRRRRPSKPKFPTKKLTQPKERSFREELESNVNLAKIQLAKLVNPNGNKQDILMMKMYEAKIDQQGGLSPHLMNTLLAAVSIEDVGDIEKNLGCRGQDCKVNLSLSGIWEYGCWCSFGSELLNGGGDPVSPHDEFCMSMTKCLRCAEKDTNGCNAVDTTYDVAGDFNPTGGQEALENACAAINGNDPCITHVCMCETNLLANIVDAVWNGVVYDSSFLHSRDFDTSQCNFARSIEGESTGNSGGNGNGNGHSSEDCCGFYPDRVPFRVSNGRQCCAGDESLFNEMDSQCCDNGVQSLGNPC